MIRIQSDRRRDGAILRMLLGAVLISAGGLAHAEIYKCVDAAGRTTYQQTPCAGMVAQKALPIATDNGVVGETPEEAARWDSVAREQNLAVGMPKHYVERLLGKPSESRPGAAGDKAAEVWTYRNPTTTIKVGFVAANVVWFRNEPPSSSQ
jgi:hypothetical protein